MSEEAEELLARLDEGRDRPLHVRLEAPASTDEGSFVVEIWRDGDLVRQDLLLTAPGVRTELSAYQLPGGNAVCQRAAEAEWVCQPSVSTATEGGDPAGLLEAAAANLGGAEVTATDEEVGGRAVRCYAIESADGASSMCLTEDGIPMRLGVQGQELTATTVEDEVDPAVFEPPAEVAAPS